MQQFTLQPQTLDHLFQLSHTGAFLIGIFVGILLVYCFSQGFGNGKD